MDFESMRKYIGKDVKLTLANNFWYRAFIISVSEKVIEFTEQKGKHISVSPDYILFVEEVLT